MKLGIIIATYKKKDGSTPEYIERAIKSINNQRHKDYKVFLIGDDYEDEEEFNSFGKILPSEKIFKKNLPIAIERSKYRIGSNELWCSGGVNAFNVAIDESLSQGYSFICHLDHDDYWSEDHLFLINNVIESKQNVGCVYTCSSYKLVPHIPKVENLDESIIDSYPQPTRVVHSSTCINFKLINLRYRDVFAETGKVLQADIDLWIRLKQQLELNKLNSYLVKKITCFHPEERNDK